MARSRSALRHTRGRAHRDPAEKGPIRRLRTGNRSKGAQEVTTNRTSKSKLKTVILKKGEKKVTALRHTSPGCSETDNKDQAQTKATPKKAEDNDAVKKKTSLITPVLLRTFRHPKLRDSRFFVYDMVSVRENILVAISRDGLVKAINTANEDQYLLSTLKLSDVADVSKIDDNTVLFFRVRRLQFVTVTPKLKLTKAIELQHGYLLLRALNNETLLGVREMTGCNTSFEMLGLDGSVRKSIRPKMLTDFCILFPKYISVNGQGSIAVIAGKSHIVFCFPISGTGGFAYLGSSKYNFAKVSEMDTETFQKEFYHMCDPCCLTSDSKGNTYIADKERGLVVKVDSHGKFVQNILPLKLLEVQDCLIRMHIDEKDNLYVADAEDCYGRIAMYKL